MTTTFKDHSVTEIEATMEKALGELLGSPVKIRIQQVRHQLPEGAALFLSNSAWAAHVEMHIDDAPPEVPGASPFSF